MNINNANKSTEAHYIELFRWILLKQETDDFFRWFDLNPCQVNNSQEMVDISFP